METPPSVDVPWTKRWTLGKNRYDHVEYGCRIPGGNHTVPGA